MESISGLSQEASEGPVPVDGEEDEGDFWGSPMAMMRKLGWMGKTELGKEKER